MEKYLGSGGDIGNVVWLQIGCVGWVWGELGGCVEVAEWGCRMYCVRFGIWV